MIIKSKDRELTCEEFESVLEECCNKVDGVSQDDWQDIVDRHNLSINYDTLRKNCTGIFGSVFVKKYYEEKIRAANSFDEEAYFVKLEEKKREIEKEMIKLRTEKIEYNKWLRDDARNELIVDRILNS